MRCSCTAGVLHVAYNSVSTMRRVLVLLRHHRLRCFFGGVPVLDCRMWAGGCVACVLLSSEACPAVQARCHPAEAHRSAAASSIWARLLRRRPRLVQVCALTGTRSRRTGARRSSGGGEAVSGSAAAAECVFDGCSFSVRRTSFCAVRDDVAARSTDGHRCVLCSALFPRRAAGLHACVLLERTVMGRRVVPGRVVFRPGKHSGRQCGIEASVARYIDEQHRCPVLLAF